MVTYKVFYKNYEKKKGELLGTLHERRNDLRGRSQFESGMRWARMAFGKLVKDRQALFVIPEEITFNRE